MRGGGDLERRRVVEQVTLHVQPLWARQLDRHEICKATRHLSIDFGIT